MSRHPWPPYDYVCPYEHTCPYLDGLSTSWVLSEYRRADDVYHEHLRIIDNFREAVQERDGRIRVLERENAELRAKYQALHRKQFKPNRKKAETDSGQSGPSSINAKAKKRGAPVGHPAWTRPIPTRIDRIVPVPRPSVCPHCGSDDLTPENTFHEHIQEDIVVKPKTVVTKYVHAEAFCRSCSRSVVQAGPDEIPNAPIGPAAKSTAGYLRYRVGISYRKTQLILADLFGLSCVPASLVGFDRKAAEKGEPLYEDVREKMRASAVVHADETSWRNDGKGYFVWFAGNDDLAFFHIDRRRSADAAKAVFGDKFDGTLVRDRYAAYNDIGTEWQSCWAHIITKAKEIGREHALLPQPEKDRRVEAFVSNVADLGKQACDAGRKLESGDLPWEKAAKIEKRFVRELNAVCKQPLRFKPAETLRSYLVGPEQK
ncbi:MAG TPA: transposase, partial [Nitrospirota bacterium]|nr:transposase [Nitrospirota bacterium]